MTSFPVQITPACTLNPPQVPPLGGGPCVSGDTITFTNNYPGTVTLNFAGAGNPFGATPPITFGVGITKTYPITVTPAPGTHQTFNYSLSCNANAAGIIIVDGGGGEGRTPPRPGTAKKAGKKKTARGTGGKSKPKATSKRGSGGTRKKSKGKTKKAARRKRK